MRASDRHVLPGRQGAGDLALLLDLDRQPQKKATVGAITSTRTRRTTRMASPSRFSGGRQDEVQILSMPPWRPD